MKIQTWQGEQDGIEVEGATGEKTVVIWKSNDGFFLETRVRGQTTGTASNGPADVYLGGNPLFGDAAAVALRDFLNEHFPTT